MGDNNGLELSQAQKRRSEDDEHEDGRRPAPPRTSRMRACAECKRHKIKCEPVPNEAKCAKCLRSGTDCVPYNMNQRFLDEDASWKANTTAKLSQLRSAVQLLLQHTNLPDLDHPGPVSPAASSRPTEDYSPANVLSNPSHSTMSMPSCTDMIRDSTAEIDLLEEVGLSRMPMTSLYDLTHVRTLSNSTRSSPDVTPPEDDFIAQGMVPLVEAEELFERYMYNINLYIWAGILFPYESLEAVRRKSSLLTAAVLTIAALHTPDRKVALQRCYSVFVSLATNTSLSRPHNLDDVRAQALGAFYLSDLSWKLSGLAVRNAVELNLHQSFQKLTRGHEAQRDNVRLWYALYVCEHQCSIAYGRPPTIHHDAAIRNVEQFLDSPNIKPGDTWLGAQVSLFKILNDAYSTYGSDPEHPLTEPDLHQLRLFNFAIEEWRCSWQTRSINSLDTGSYPFKDMVLYYHFVRVHLNSLALRALPPPSDVTFQSLSYDRLEAANVAIAAATTTLTLIFETLDLECAMPALPVFTHTMVAFCSTFLLKVAKTWGSIEQAQSPLLSSELDFGFDFNVNQIVSLSKRSATFLARASEVLNEKHLTSHIVQSINELLDSLRDMNNGITMKSGYDMHEFGSFGFGSDDKFLDRLSSTNLDFWETDALC